jgi:hypothetical protein
MTDGVLKRLAQLERRARRGEQHHESGRVEQTLVDRPTYAAAARDLLVECHLPVWKATDDADLWCRERGLSVEVIVYRLFVVLDEHPQLAGVGRAEARQVVLGKPETPNEYYEAWCRLNGRADR